MPLESEDRLSADVIVRPASGRAFAADTEITAATVAEYAPSPLDRVHARDAFRELGFEIGPEGPLGFALVGDVATFERAFRVRLRRDERGAVLAMDLAGDGSDLPLSALPDDLQIRLVAVGFGQPPDFGPSVFGP